MLKNAPPGTASFLSAAANKVLSFWWVLFWSSYKSWWHAWRKANISELSVFPHNSCISAEEKLKLLSLSPLQSCLCSLAAWEAVWCHHRVSDKNRCIRNIFLWQLNFNGVCDFTELNKGKGRPDGSNPGICVLDISMGMCFLQPWSTRMDGKGTCNTWVLTLKLWDVVTFLHFVQRCWKPSIENQLPWMYSTQLCPSLWQSCTLLVTATHCHPAWTRGSNKS